MADFRAKARSGAPLCGTFIATPHPVSAEVTARAGFDFVCIDCEHSQIGRGGIEDLVRACEVGGTAAMIRVPANTPEAVNAALDAGAVGVLVPRVSTAAQARAAVAATRYPPEGERGAGPGRASRYGTDIANYIASANARIVLAVQVETATAVENIEEIARVEGVDVVFIGPGDLAVSLGAFGPAGHEVLMVAMEKVVASCKAAGRTVGIFRPTVDDLAAWRDRGCSFNIVASDTMFLGAALSAAAKQVIVPASED